MLKAQKNAFTLIIKVLIIKKSLFKPLEHEIPV